MHAIVHGLVYLCTTALGVLLLLYAAHPEWREQVLAWSGGAAGLATIASLAGVFLLAPLVHFLAWWGRSLRSREISYSTDNGRIAVSLVAIEEALTRALEGEPEVKKAHVRVLQDRVKNSVLIDAVMTLWEVPNVTERNRFCQRLLRRRFAELMPEQDLVQVDLTVHRLNVRRAEDRPAAAPAAAAAAPAPPAAAELPSGDDDSGERPGMAGADDLYVGPTYPVVRPGEDEDEWQARPPSTRVARRR